MVLQCESSNFSVTYQALTLLGRSPKPKYDPEVPGSRRQRAAQSSGVGGSRAVVALFILSGFLTNVAKDWQLDNGLRTVTLRTTMKRLIRLGAMVLLEAWRGRFEPSLEIFAPQSGLANRRIQPLCQLSAANVLQHCNL
jgi:hypothetical protein